MVKVAVAAFRTAPGVADGIRSAVVVVIPADTAGRDIGIHFVDVTMLDLPTVMTSDAAFVLAEKVRPLMVIVKGVLPDVAGILAPVTVKVIVLVLDARDGVTSAAPTLKTSMPVDATLKFGPSTMLKSSSIGVFIKKETIKLEQEPILHELRDADVT